MPGPLIISNIYVVLFWLVLTRDLRLYIQDNNDAQNKVFVLINHCYKCLKKGTVHYLIVYEKD